MGRRLGLKCYFGGGRPSKNGEPTGASLTIRNDTATIQVHPTGKLQVWASNQAKAWELLNLLGFEKALLLQEREIITRYYARISSGRIV